MSLLKKIQSIHPSLPNLSGGKVVNMHDIPVLCTYIAEFKKKVSSKLKLKACYRNALEAMRFFNKKGFDVEYVEGFSTEMAIDHAWNAVVIDGIRYMFDVTASELAITFDDEYVDVYSSKDVVLISKYIRKQFITVVYKKINWYKKNPTTPFVLNV